MRTEIPCPYCSVLNQTDVDLNAEDIDRAKILQCSRIEGDTETGCGKYFVGTVEIALTPVAYTIAKP